MLLQEEFIAVYGIQYAAPNVTSHALGEQRHKHAGSALHQGNTGKTL